MDRSSSSSGGRLRDRLRVLFLHRAVSRGMREHPELTTSATGPAEVQIVGVDPIRVLVIGSGLAAGYGVRTHAEGLTGALASEVRGSGGRGVIVQNRANGRARVEQTVAELEGVGATACNIVVWCPSMLDILRMPDRGRYHRTLVEGLRTLRETARPGAEIILCALPIPTRRGPVEEIARRVVPRFNAGLRRAVASLPDVRVADAPTFTSLLDPAALSADYYLRVAAQIMHPDAVAQARSA